MNLLEPTPAGSAMAAGLVVAGAPVFSAGLRVLRLRRRLAGLAERPLAEAPTGFVLVRGRVALASPLVGPLSGNPCAGFTLEIRGGRTSARVVERRAFRLQDGGVTAQVLADPGTWELSPTAERRFTAGAALSQNLTALLQDSAEAAWIRRRRPFVLVERALLAGQECWVLGQATHAPPFELEQEHEFELRRTGTDGAAHAPLARSQPPEPDLWIRSDAHLQFLRVSDRRPDPAELMPPPWGLVLTAAGPLLSLTGLIYLARAAERWRGAIGG